MSTDLREFFAAGIAGSSGGMHSAPCSWVGRESLMIETESDFRFQLFLRISIPLYFCPSSGPAPNPLLKGG